MIDLLKMSGRSLETQIWSLREWSVLKMKVKSHKYMEPGITGMDECAVREYVENRHEQGQNLGGKPERERT